MECSHFQNELHGEDRREDDVQIIQRLGIIVRLFVVLDEYAW